MLQTPERYEIDHRTLKLLVGVIAIFLPIVTSAFAHDTIESVSASYHQGGWSRDTLVGSLFAIAAFLLAYNGNSRFEMILSKIGALAAIGVALFPCACASGHREIVRGLHGMATAVMFLVLAVFCVVFLRRARAKGHAQAKVRVVLYAVCGAVIVLSGVLIAVNHFFKQLITSTLPRFVFYAELAALVAFGTAWLLASRVLPFFSSARERFLPLGGRTADNEAG